MFSRPGTSHSRASAAWAPGHFHGLATSAEHLVQNATGFLDAMNFKMYQIEGVLIRIYYTTSYIMYIMCILYIYIYILVPYVHTYNID